MGNDRERKTRRQEVPKAEVKSPFMAQGTLERAPLLDGVPNVGLLLDRVLASGDAIILAHTRDGGAVALTILRGEARFKVYAANQLELLELMDSLSLEYSPDAGAPGV